jgi:putative oxidoreductase
MQNANQINQGHSDMSGDYDFLDVIQLRKDDIGRLVLRLAIGGLMLFHGMNKIIYGTEQVEGFLTRAGIPALVSFGVFIGEVLAPIFLILGFKTRIAACFVAINMIIATLLVHASDFNELTNLGGWMLELNALYFLGALAIIFLGSGRISLSKGKGALD